jgi:thioredoxin-dependent peroxiredoxin
MSKKTRKKSPKPAMGTTTRARSQTSAKTPASKTGPKAAAKSGKTTNKQTANASHKAPSKPLKSSSPAKPLPPKVAAVSKAAAVKPEAAIPSTANATAKKPEAGSPPATKKATAPSAISLMPKAPAGKAASTAGPKPALAEGMKAPAFQLPRDGGGTVSLADFSGKKLVLFFYPRADTPGCTREAIDFTRLASAFAESQTTVLGVSADSPKAQEAFRDKHELSVPLVSDEQHTMLEAYGVWGEKSMYGRTFQGILRTTVLIGADGRIVKIWRHVKVDGHADEVLAAVQAR